jgi:hypothetical protein
MAMTAGICHLAVGQSRCDSMTAGSLGDEDIERIDRSLQDWWQGDVVLDPDSFMVYLADREFPLTSSARADAANVDSDQNIFDVLIPVCGWVIISQTCDIVKKCVDSEFVEICRLVRIPDEGHFQDVRKARRPRYAYVPGVAEKKLVADLEHTMTIEKSVLARCSRVQGCATDKERVTFAEVLARKRKRFAFPDGFNTGLRKFRDNIKDKHGKNSPEGRLVDAIHEIRIQPIPHWESDSVSVFFWILLRKGVLQDFDTARADLKKWLGRVSFPQIFVLADPAFELVEPSDMTVEDYFNSYPLDYDDVSP